MESMLKYEHAVQVTSMKERTNIISSFFAIKSHEKHKLPYCFIINLLVFYDYKGTFRYRPTTTEF